MTKKKGNPAICVETLPNGYALRVDDQDYMYLSPMKLLAGMFYHVGLAKLDAVNSDNIESIMEAIMSWSKVEDAAKSQANIAAQLREARRDLQLTRQQYARLEITYEKAAKDLKDVEGRLFLAQKQIKADEELGKRLTGAIDAFNKENARRIKIEKELIEERHRTASLCRELAAWREGKRTPDGVLDAGQTDNHLTDKKHGRSRKEADELILEFVNNQNKTKI